MICSGSPELLGFVARLVGAGVSFDPAGDTKRTPLFIALAARNLDCARFLVKYGAPIAPAFEQGDWLDEQSVSLLDELRPSEDTLLSWIPELARAGRTHHLLTWSGLSGKIRTSLAFGLS